MIIDAFYVLSAQCSANNFQFQQLTKKQQEQDDDGQNVINDLLLLCISSDYLCVELTHTLSPHRERCRMIAGVFVLFWLHFMLFASANSPTHQTANHSTTPHLLLSLSIFGKWRRQKYTYTLSWLASHRSLFVFRLTTYISIG